MRFEYQHVARATITADDNRRVHGERVPPGWILTVKSCYMYVPEIGTPHIAAILIETGQGEIEVRVRGKEVGRVGISALNGFYVGEHQRVVGYTPDAEVGDQLSLTVIGYLTPLWDWRKWAGKGA